MGRFAAAPDCPLPCRLDRAGNVSVIADRAEAVALREPGSSSRPPPCTPPTT